MIWLWFLAFWMLYTIANEIAVIYGERMIDNVKRRVSYALTYFGLALMYPVFIKSYSKAWDKTLNKILDAIEANCVQATVDEHTLNVNGCEIWIANRWFAYGYLYCHDRHYSSTNEHRPKISTMIRLNEIVKRLEARNPKVKPIENIYSTIKKSFSNYE